MGETHKNIWDSIEVDMYAEFDAVKAFVVITSNDGGQSIII